jgi:magnesium chelatase subunit D
MKLALILNVVDPLIGGVLIMGHRGTGKSTAVRALADLLPQISVVHGCLFNCDPKNIGGLCNACSATDQKLVVEQRSIPVVDLPLGATEDRVCGTIAIERALREGVKTFEPGLLAHANRGFLYIDEVNLLEDHLVDLLLDVAATGLNRVEREGVSIEHPSQFVLVGSGNPEEGELRPQLLDRFGLHVDVVTPTDAEQRVTIVERREAYDRDQEKFASTYANKQEELRASIVRARRTFANVKIDHALLRQMVEMCIALNVDGHRGELTLMRASRALAALEGRKKVTEGDVKKVSAMCLRHRLRRSPLEDAVSDEMISQALNEQFGKGDQSSGGKDKRANSSAQSSSVREFPSPPSDGVSKLRMESDQTRQREQQSRSDSKRGRKGLNNERGRHARSVIARNLATKVAVAATLSAVASLTNRAGSKLTPVDTDALRYKLFSRKQGALFIFAIDTSGSMAVRRIALAKRIMLDRLRQSYVNRDRVAIISFRGTSATLELPPSRSILRARRMVDSLQMGGGTPLAAGLAVTLGLLKTIKRNEEESVVLLFTDGRANVPLKQMEGVGQQRSINAEIDSLAAGFRKSRSRVVVIDTQPAFESSEETRRLAAVLNAQFVKPNSAS